LLGGFSGISISFDAPERFRIGKSMTEISMRQAMGAAGSVQRFCGRYTFGWTHKVALCLIGLAVLYLLSEVYFMFMQGR
jgi:hypothetical protein